MPESEPHTGTLITLAPAPRPLGHLLRCAIDAEQVGASRIHLDLDQDEFVAVVAGLRRQTGLVITTDPGHPGADLVDPLPRDFAEIILDEGTTPIDLVAREEVVGRHSIPRASRLRFSRHALVAQVARIAEERDGDVSLAGRGEAAVPVLFAALAVGAHLRVGTAHTPLTPPPTDLRGDPRPRGRDDVALVARASGLARIAGRPPLEGRAAQARWRIG